ncbi:MAG: maleylacetoacetate isomerase [Deltaproteobacteria bacterium]|nr:maleylacetoacetate isomerase [Deltaproteobacteria bacterium]
MSLVLRSYWRSSCSWRVRIGLNWKQLPYDIVPVHLVADGGQQHSDTHRALNPSRELPVLLVDGEPLAQSVAILEYLEETHPDPPLLPRSPLDRARVRQMTEVVNSGIQPVQNLRVMQRLGREYDFSRADQVGWSRDWIALGLTALEQLVSNHGGRYSFGDSVSWADLCLVPQLYNARRFDVDLTAFPSLTAVESQLESLPEFVAAHPDQQPDAA